MKQKLILVGWPVSEQQKMLKNELKGLLDSLTFDFKDDSKDIVQYLEEDKDRSLLGIVFNNNFQKENEDLVKSICSKARLYSSKLYYCTISIHVETSDIQKKMIWENTFGTMR